jgi:hypothetical protein
MKMVVYIIYKDIKRLKTFKNTKDNEKINKIMEKGSY